MMMDWRHAENALATILVRSDLKDNRQRLNNKNTPDDYQQNFLFRDHSYAPQRTAQGKGTHIPHKNLGRIGVIPEKSQSGAHHGIAEYGQLPRTCYSRHLQIGRKGGMAGDITEQHIGGGIDRHRTNGQSIQSVGQVNGIAGTHYDYDDKGDIPNPDVRMKIFEKGHIELFSVSGLNKQENSHRPGQQNLPEHLLSRREPLGIFFDHFFIIIHKPDQAVADSDEQHRPDVGVGEIRPQQGGNNNRRQDHYAAHRSEEHTS